MWGFGCADAGHRQRSGCMGVDGAIASGRWLMSGCVSASIVLGVGSGRGLCTRCRLTRFVWVLAAFVGDGVRWCCWIWARSQLAGPRLGIAAFGVFYLGLLCAPMAILQRDAAARAGLGDAGDRADVQQRHGGLLRRPRLGRHKLYPAVSPAKTVEGAIGGMLAGLLIMLGARATFVPWLTIKDCLLAALPAGVIGPTGDLVESLHQAGVRREGLRKALDPRPRRHAGPHRRPPVRLRLALRLRPLPRGAHARPQPKTVCRRFPNRRRSAGGSPTRRSAGGSPNRGLPEVPRSAGRFRNHSDVPSKNPRNQTGRRIPDRSSREAAISEQAMLRKD